MLIIDMELFMLNDTLLGKEKKDLAMLVFGLTGAILKAQLARDQYTSEHQRKVAKLAGDIASRMGMNKADIEAIRLGACLHDIGKIKIPYELLTYPRKLDTIEYELVKSHTTAGYDILSGIEHPIYIRNIALQHHERCDGSGYPSGVMDKDICDASKIVAVADVVDALTNRRPYRSTWGIDLAIEEIRKGRGTKYWSRAVDECIGILTDE